MPYLDYFFLTIGLLISYKITYWFSMYQDGFKLCTPMLFIKYQSVYLLIEIMSFLAALFLLDITGMIIIPAYFFTGVIAREFAIRKRNKILEEINEYKSKKGI